MDCWYMPEGIANILLMHKLKQLYRITYDSWDRFYVVHHPKGFVHFKKDHQGLPYIGLGESSEEAVVLLVQTVRSKFVEGYTKKEVVKEKETQRLQGMLDRVSEKDFKGMVSSNTLKNNTITLQAITHANNLFRRDLTRIRGKRTRITPDPVVENYVDIPQTFMLTNKHVTMAADVFFIDRIPFLLSLSLDKSHLLPSITTL